MSTFSDKKSSKVHACETCQYETIRPGQYARHVATAQHVKLTATSMPPLKEHKCEKCNKKYADRKGLWRHKKSCGSQEPEPPITSKTMYDLMKIIVDQQAKIIELTESKNKENR
jgi:hypothetical protein